MDTNQIAWNHALWLCGSVRRQWFPEFAVFDADNVVRADMNERRPLEDDSLDVVVSQEGIEHLES